MEKQRRCLNCSEPLYTLKKGKRYCSELCRIKLFQKRQRAEHKFYKRQIQLLLENIPELFTEEGEVNRKVLKEIKEMI